MAHTPEKLLLASPRGYCAGVDRAVQTVERALEVYGAPVYVRKEIVHHKHVVEQLRERGAIFVEAETEVQGQTMADGPGILNVPSLGRLAAAAAVGGCGAAREEIAIPASADARPTARWVNARI